ncbi:MAG: protocatechuate 3,4-dioxygenase [Gammaproteobacteria bacterium]
MVWSRHDYDKIPGTYVFDGQKAVMGYALNKMCMSFNSAENRQAFADDEDAYCNKYGLTDEQRETVKKRDWLHMLQLGGNIYYLFKLATVNNYNVQDASAQMTGMSVDEFKAKLLAEGADL